MHGQLSCVVSVCGSCFKCNVHHLTDSCINVFCIVCRSCVFSSRLKISSTILCCSIKLQSIIISFSFKRRCSSCGISVVFCLVRVNGGVRSSDWRSLFNHRFLPSANSHAAIQQTTLIHLLFGLRFSQLHKRRLRRNQSLQLALNCLVRINIPFSWLVTASCNISSCVPSCISLLYTSGRFCC